MSSLQAHCVQATQSNTDTHRASHYYFMIFNAAHTVQKAGGRQQNR